MPSSIWGTHLDALRQKFPGRVQILQLEEDTSNESLSTTSQNLVIVQKIRVIHPSGWDVQIHLPQGFPDDAPLILFAGYKCPFRWSAADGTMLHDAVDHAVHSLDKLSGSLGPININKISNEIASQQQEQCEAAVGADSMKAFVDQSSFGIQAQKELDVVWDTIEDTCKSNLNMQPEIAQAQQEVAQLQYQVKSGLAGLGSRRKDVLEVLPLGSNEGLMRSAREELKELEDAAAQVCKALGSVSASKNLVENMKKKKRRNRLHLQQQQQQQQMRSRSPQSATTAGAHISFNSATPRRSAQTPDVLSSLNPDLNTTSENNNNNNKQDGSSDNNTNPNTNNTTENNNYNPNMNNNNNNMFVVPDSSPSTTSATTTTDVNLVGTTASTNPMSANSVFSSVAQAPLSFNLEKNSNNNNNEKSGDNTGSDNNKSDDSDEDEDEDVMDKAVDYAMKVCIEARKAAMLLRRFGGQ